MRNPERSTEDPASEDLQEANRDLHERRDRQKRRELDPPPDDTPPLFAVADLKALDREAERFRRADAVADSKARQQAAERVEKFAHYRAESAEQLAESARVGEQRAAAARAKAAAAKPDSPATAKRCKPAPKRKQISPPRPAAATTPDTRSSACARLVAVDQRPRAILPHSLRHARRNQETLPLALDRHTPLGPVREYEQGYLPGLVPPRSLVPPVPWLTLYDLTGTGPIQTRGRGAPLAQRLFVEVLTAIGIQEREWLAAPPITLRNLFEWCWPRYYDAAADRMRGGYQRNKHLKLLRRALVELDNMRIEHGRYERRLIRVDDLPTSATALDDPIRFHVRHLPDSDRGPMIERTSTRRWGVVSAPAWRSTIRLAYMWDEAKGRNNGSRIYATRPVVARSVDGDPLGDDGTLLRDHRGVVVKDWSDPRAILLGVDGNPASKDNPPAHERNPAADRVPVLGPDDLIRLAFDGNITNSNRRERLRLARKSVAEKEAADEVAIERDGKGWRIIESKPRQWAEPQCADPDTC